MGLHGVLRSELRIGASATNHFALLSCRLIAQG
jgi:hypothetical protein